VTYADAPIRRFGRTYCRPCYEAIRFSAVTDTTGLVALWPVAEPTSTAGASSDSLAADASAMPAMMGSTSATDPA
jgi:hypothetical protein